MNVKGKVKDGRVETTRLKNLGGIKSEGGLLSLFVVVLWSAVWKFQLHFFPLWCVIFVLPSYKRALFLRALKQYILLLVLIRVDYLLTKIKVFVNYVAHNLLKYQSYICIDSQRKV